MVQMLSAMLQAQKRGVHPSAAASSSSSPSPPQPSGRSRDVGKSRNNVNKSHSSLSNNFNTFISSSTPSPPPLSDEMASAFGMLSEYHKTQDVGGRLHASTTQKENAESGQFVALANFCVVNNNHYDTSSSSSSSFPPMDPAMSMFNAILEGSIHFRDQKERARDANIPRFYTFEQVILAFTSGLTPIVCRGRPDRLADYLIFIHLLCVEYSKGRYHWPVLLYYIERRRRLCLMANVLGNDAHTARIRDAHRLTSYTQEGEPSLDDSLLRDASSVWMSRTTCVLFLEDHLDKGVLQSLQSLPTPYEAGIILRHQAPPLQPPSRQYSRVLPSSPSLSSSSSPSPPTSAGGERGLLTSKVPGLTTAMIVFLKKQGEGDRACYGFLSGTCVAPAGQECPKGYNHFTIADIKARMAQGKKDKSK